MPLSFTISLFQTSLFTILREFKLNVDGLFLLATAELLQQCLLILHCDHCLPSHRLTLPSHWSDLTILRSDWPAPSGDIECWGSGDTWSVEHFTVIPGRSVRWLRSGAGATGGGALSPVSSVSKYPWWHSSVAVSTEKLWSSQQSSGQWSRATGSGRPDNIKHQQWQENTLNPSQDMSF